MKSAHAHVYKRCRLLRYFLWQQHCYSPKNRPNIEVRDPPCGKAVQQTGQEYKNVQRIQSLFPIHDRHRNNKYANQMHIRSNLHNYFRGVHQSAQHRKNSRLFRCQLHAILPVGRNKQCLLQFLLCLRRLRHNRHLHRMPSTPYLYRNRQ